MLNSGERQTIFLSLQSIQKDNLLLLLAGVSILLVVFFLLLHWSARRKERRIAKKEPEPGSGYVPEDTARMPEFQDICLEQYGFQVVEDITYIHTREKITLEKDGGYDGMDYE